MNFEKIRACKDELASREMISRLLMVKVMGSYVLLISCASEKVMKVIMLVFVSHFQLQLAGMYKSGVDLFIWCHEWESLICAENVV